MYKGAFPASCSHTRLWDSERWVRVLGLWGFEVPELDPDLINPQPLKGCMPVKREGPNMQTNLKSGCRFFLA